MIGVYWYVLLELDVVNPFENCESMPDAYYGHLFQLLVSQGDQRFAVDLIL